MEDDRNAGSVVLEVDLVFVDSVGRVWHQPLVLSLCRWRSRERMGRAQTWPSSELRYLFERASDLGVLLTTSTRNEPHRRPMTLEPSCSLDLSKVADGTELEARRRSRVKTSEWPMLGLPAAFRMSASVGSGPGRHQSASS